MKYVNRKQSLIITGSTPIEFQDRLNEALNTVAEKGCKYDLTFNNNMGFCAYLLWDERIEVAETLADEYELKGIKFMCQDCPMFRPSDDRRVKYTTCDHGERMCYHSQDACGWFYEQLEARAITVVGADEENQIESKDNREVRKYGSLCGSDGH